MGMKRTLKKAARRARRRVRSMPKPVRRALTDALMIVAPAPVVIAVTAAKAVRRRL